MAFYQIEPFGTEVDMLGHSMTVTAIANANSPKGKKYKVSDFMPDFEKAHRTQSTDEMIQFAAYMTEVMGGKDKRHEHDS